jgi:hypothetical protein
MSFQAAHLRFAQKVQDIIHPQDLTRYFSGTLYPDSRYITGVDRAKTHTDVRIEPKKILDLTDDFDKGWQVHLWYDKLGLHHLDQIVLNRSWTPNDADDVEVWSQLTGAKLIEDLYWWQNTDWQQILPYLKFTNNPHNEDKQILNNWYQHFIDFYQKQPDLQAYRQQAKFMGIESKKIDQIHQFAHTLYNNQSKNLRIQKVMNQVIEEFKNLVTNN